ncbi:MULTISPECIES: nucleoside triphosphate pyrophosphatase [unclassified Mycolicibacterium]|uniref:Maf family protein n=1 Tax=unclassified Mycolicibacterium TaxID=2636767 RepID=UPI0012DCDCED|nr:MULTISPECIES: nucleoside triphosphate pyrophosphatase [unclassified Mycolicibacterium]MUL81068.1 septum formation inhibitor Maf [Mycolicibacterium sp. CBMA 329]MUL86834.1 septum formation inhibitor Maf [Mycolicibacterium sp. CBMA 331]MUL98881.1 septum formation inhibitor Maf [Mycolicibacterium sp. CBMA 334]MUM28989.1 septum formation inhibitor Maf [Mycolicibacterium sp. CBMA 295]MUM37131.1 septum formation inhibitor Maf [Mycolicibacterium sp. CBMA 247]
MTRVVLGSASTGRLGVLRQAGLDPLVVVSGVDEDAVIASLADAPPERVVAGLAGAKADEVLTHLPAAIAADCVVIGCDSMLFLDGLLCGKPGDVDTARRQWQAMSGRTAQLYSGHAVLAVRDGSVTHRIVDTGITAVHFGSPTEADLEAYLRSGEPLGVAGGFTLDGLGGWFVDSIEGDPSNVIGLSLPLLRRMLAAAGVSIADLWKSSAQA